MIQDIINKMARGCKVPLSVREINKQGDIVSIGVRGAINANSRAFLSRFFQGATIYVYEI